MSANVTRMIGFYNDQVGTLHQLGVQAPPNISEYVDYAADRIKWNRSLLQFAQKGRLLQFSGCSIYQSMYRPFTKEWLYFSRELNDQIYQLSKLFPTSDHNNLVIYVTGPGAGKDPACLMTDAVPNLHMMDTGQAFPLYWYEKRGRDSRLPGIDDASADSYIRHNGIGTCMLEQFQKIYSDPSISKTNIFYYVYGVLHSPEYRERFAADLTKMLPRIPFTEDFWAFSNAGRELGELHVGYESVEPWPVSETRTQLPFRADGTTMDDRTLYQVEQMRWAGTKRLPDKSTIIYNDCFTLTNIPLEAYNYIVNGKSAIEWVMERYAVTQDKESKIVNDPNKWSDDPRYIIDLVIRIVRVSMETNRIVASLPQLNERDVEIKLGTMATS